LSGLFFSNIIVLIMFQLSRRWGRGAGRTFCEDPGLSK